MSTAEEASANATAMAEAAAQAECMDNHMMEYYFLSSICTFAAFLVSVLVPRLLSAPCRNRKSRVRDRTPICMSSHTYMPITA